VKAQQEYWKGDAQAARETLQPELDKNVEKDTKAKNLFLWDMGVYCFSVADYECAAEMFEASVQAYQEIHGTGKTAKSMFKSASGMKYAGDPVEISTAWLFMGLSFHLSGNTSNGMVALRRSIEEDICKEADCEGNMVVTNFLMGEYYRRQGAFDDAVVAFRRAIQFSPDLVPAYVGLHEALSAQGKVSDAEQAYEQLSERVDPSYLADIKECGDQGALVVMYGERCPSVTKDMFTGMFRKRRDIRAGISSWQISANPSGGQYQMNLADQMSTHVHEQGGFGGEAKKQVTRAVVGTAMKQIPCVGLFAPSTDADLRYWATMPGSFYIGYIPLKSGEYNFQVTGFDHKGREVPMYAKNWSSIIVEEGVKPMIFASGYTPAALQ